MEPFIFVIFGVVVTIFAGAGVHRWLFSTRARARRVLRKAPRVSIARARDGQLVKLAGRLRLADEPVVAPLTGRPCAYYRTTVKQKKGSGNSSHWSTIIDDCDFCGKLWLEDGTGRALVDLVYPLVVLTMDNHFSSGVLDDATPDLEQFLAKHDVASEGWIFNKTLRYKEGMLEQGERIAVFGLCRWEPDPDPAAASGAGFRERALRLRVLAPPEGRTVLSDDPSML